MFAQRPPLRRGGSCRGSRGGRPMVAPTFTAGTAIKFVGADILARQSLRRLRRHLPLHKGGYPLRRGRADEYPQGAGRICNAPSSRTAALGIGPYTVRWKLAGTGGQGRPPLQSVPHRQRREIFCQKKARGRRHIGYTSSPQQRTSGRKDLSLDHSGLICSMTKHSKMSPSLMSLNFSIDMPHS